MKRFLPTVTWRVCPLLLATSCLGCGAVRSSLVGTEAVRLENSAQGKAYIAWSDAHAEDDGFLVSGVVRRRDHVGPPLEVRVRAEVVSPSGVILDRVESAALSIPRRRVSRAQGLQRFHLHFPHMPPEGSSVRIVARVD